MRFLKRAAVGAEAGLLAGGGVAVLFMILDAFQFGFLTTASSLASSLLGNQGAPLEADGLAQVAAVGALGLAILAYTVLHLTTFAFVGVAGAFLLDATSFWASLFSGVVYGSAVCTGILYAGEWIANAPLALDSLGVPSVLLANAMAGAILGIGLHLGMSDEGEPAA